jgi:dTDP-4-amino-4,6-dideoxygalactose transaminase
MTTTIGGAVPQPEQIVFSRPFRSAHELANLERVLVSDHAHGDGQFTKSATEKLKEISHAERALLTSSCTHALELAGRLLDLGPGDEVILPSFTFPSAATAIALTGATCVFVDVDLRHGNIDAQQVAEAVTANTRAISVVNYGGVAVDFDSIMAIASEHDLPVIEDNAHGLGGSYKGLALGSFGALAAQSFHDTKNIHSGEGGALLVNDASFMERAEIIREKGTNRSLFLRGQVDKYTWVDIGSSFLMSEYSAAVLDSQLESFALIQALRFGIWDAYAAGLADWASEAGIRLMDVPADREHTAHLFFLQLANHADQVALLAHLRAAGVVGTFHYIPLDSSPAGRRYGRTLRELTVSTAFSERLVRLPLWAGMSDAQIERVVAAVRAFRPTAS